MRILGFSRKWPKLKQPYFTTFRFARKDKDWQAGETVHIVYNPRSKAREILGTAFIMSKASRGMCRLTPSLFPHVSDEEARHDGFYDYLEMWAWLAHAYGKQRLIDQPMNKLTLAWIKPNERENDMA